MRKSCFGLVCCLLLACSATAQDIPLNLPSQRTARPPELIEAPQPAAEQSPARDYEIAVPSITPPQLPAQHWADAVAPISTTFGLPFLKWMAVVDCEHCDGPSCVTCGASSPAGSCIQTAAKCAASCGAKCAAACDAKCAASCGDKCAASCEAKCAASCGDKCATSCDAKCAASCGAKCATACGDKCAAACDAKCAASCGDCPTDCRGSCPTGSVARQAPASTYPHPMPNYQASTSAYGYPATPYGPVNEAQSPWARHAVAATGCQTTAWHAGCACGPNCRCGQPGARGPCGCGASCSCGSAAAGQLSDLQQAMVQIRVLQKTLDLRRESEQKHRELVDALIQARTENAHLAARMAVVEELAETRVRLAQAESALGAMHGADVQALASENDALRRKVAELESHIREQTARQAGPPTR